MTAFLKVLGRFAKAARGVKADFSSFISQSPRFSEAETNKSDIGKMFSEFAQL